MVKEPARRDTGLVANASAGAAAKAAALANGDAVIEVDGGMDECVDGNDEAPLNRPQNGQSLQADGGADDATASKAVL